MAKTNKELLEYLAKHSEKVGKLFDEFVKELAKSGIPYDQLPDDVIFKYSRYPEIAKSAAKIADKMRDRLRSEFLRGIRGAIALAVTSTSEEFKPYSKMSDNAIQTFRDNVAKSYIDGRVNTEKGLSLSDRVWNYTEQTKSEFELALSQVLEDGIRSGASAEEVGRAVRDKLRNPDMMYRRYHRKKILKNGKKVDVVEWRRKVVDADGKVRFIKEDLAKVGRGVYRSARQNALRMAGSEISGAYYYAENMQYQKEPFVLGYRINLSNNHHCKGVKEPPPYHDMCDDLAGDYPKWFLWKAWHPRCRCYMTAILCSEEEMRKISTLSKEDYENYVSPNAIKDMPSNYNDYVETNRDRIEGAIERGTQPYWIQDNYVDGDINKGFVARTAPVEIAPVAEKSPADLAREADLAQYTEEQKRNFEELEKRFGVKRGTSMDYDEANTGNENPRYSEGGQYRVNCQTCTVTHELRRRGFNVTAKGAKEGFDKLKRDNGSEFNWKYRFLNPDGSKIEPETLRAWKGKKGYPVVTKARLDEYFAETMAADGRYEVYCAWSKKSAHVFCVEVKNGQQFWFDPQTGKSGASVLDYKSRMRTDMHLYAMRIDDKIINPEMAKAFNASEGVEKVIKTKAQRMAEIAQIAAKRHAERNTEAIMERWRESRTIARAHKVVELAKDYPQLDTEDLVDAIEARDIALVTRQGKKLAHEIAIERSLTPVEIRHSELLKQFSKEDVKAVYDNTARTMSKYASLGDVEKAEKYRFEADWIRKNRSFATKEAVAKIYEREAERLERKIKLANLQARVSSAESTLKSLGLSQASVLTSSDDILSITRLEYQIKELERTANHFKTVKEIVDFSSSAKSKPLAELVIKIQELIAKDGYRADITTLVEDAKKRVEQIKRQHARAAAKKLGKGYGFRPGETLEELVKRLGKDCPETLRKLQPIIDKYEADLAFKYTDDERQKLIAKIKEALEKFDFGMNIEGQYLENCMDEHFKNQFETGSSGGALFSSKVQGDIDISNGRYKASKDMFGFSNRGNDSRPKYEKYGSLLDTDIKTSLSKNGAGQYGEVEIRFKKDKVLCTWTRNDSLCKSYQPSLVSDPKISSFGRSSPFVDGLNRDYDTVSKLRSDLWSSYIELQYHGVLDFTCVESVTFPNEVSYAKWKHLVPRMKKDFGVKVFYLDKNTGDLIEV